PEALVSSACARLGWVMTIGMADCMARIAATAIAFTSVVFAAPSIRMIPLWTWRVTVTRIRLTGSVLDRDAGSMPTAAAAGTSMKTTSSLVPPNPSFRANRQGAMTSVVVQVWVYVGSGAKSFGATLVPL